MKRIETCSSELCRRPFQVNKYANVSFSILERGRIACPHCGTLQNAEGDAIFMTHALAPQEEADYLKEHSGIGQEREFSHLEDVAGESLKLSGPVINSDFMFRHSTSFSR